MKCVDFSPAVVQNKGHLRGIDAMARDRCCTGMRSYNTAAGLKPLSTVESTETRGRLSLSVVRERGQVDVTAQLCRESALHMKMPVSDTSGDDSSSS